MSKKATKRGPKPLKRKQVILRLREHKRATSAELQCSTAFIFTLLQQGLVRRVGIEDKSGKGRKRIIWALTPAGNGVASAIQRQQKIAA